MSLPAYILSGGQSRRFGSDKARHQTSGGPQLLVLTEQLRGCGHAVHVVADRSDRYADLGLTCLVDVQPDSGPLSGLASALAHREQSMASQSDSLSGWLLLVSCDQRAWQPTWTVELSKHMSQAVDASIYYDTQWQPLPGLYHVNLLPTVMHRLASGQLSLHGLLDSLSSRCMKVRTTQPPSHWSFNTKDDLLK